MCLFFSNTIPIIFKEDKEEINAIDKKERVRMRKYVVGLLIVLYTIILCSVYLPKITSKYEITEQQAYVTAQETYTLYKEQNQRYSEQLNETKIDQTGAEPVRDKFTLTDFYKAIPIFVILLIVGVAIVRTLWIVQAYITTGRKKGETA